MQSTLVSFGKPLSRARFLARRNRFLADMELEDGGLLTAHCPNTGSMKGCLSPGAETILWDSGNPARKLRHTWRAIRMGETWVGVDTSLTNRIAESAILGGLIPELPQEARLRREVPMGASSRVDLVLEPDQGPRVWIEVKNVSLVQEGRARFPDAVTARGLKHLVELEARLREGDRAAMVYIIHRGDGVSFEPAGDIDPEYAAALRAGAARGLEIYAVGCLVTPEGVIPRERLPVILD